MLALRFEAFMTFLNFLPGGSNFPADFYAQNTAIVPFCGCEKPQSKLTQFYWPDQSPRIKCVRARGVTRGTDL
jgi:hypothetical protein